MRHWRNGRTKVRPYLNEKRGTAPLEESMRSVSVIVPVYNVEKYLARCLDSLLNQTQPDIEILVVNDGSTDASGHIVDESIPIGSGLSTGKMRACLRRETAEWQKRKANT